jgi:hypothetical protein
MEQKQTAVEWLVQQLRNGKEFNDELIQQAKAMEKEEIMYSEEEVLEILQKWSMYQVDIELNKLNIKELNDVLKKTLSYKEWFGQIKKK